MKINAIALLGILFVGLKLTGHITWSWWLVTIPFWWPLGIFVLMIIFLMIVEAVK